MKKLLFAAGLYGFLALFQAPQIEAQRGDRSLTTDHRTRSSLSENESEGREVLERGPASEAVAWLKAAVERHPDSKTLRWLLARAYLEDDNTFWALRTLNDLASRFPRDCEPWLWSAWIQLQQGALEQARDSLESASCRPNTPAAARKSLLYSMVEQHAEKPDYARQHLQEAKSESAMYAEDLAVLNRQITMLDPGYIAPLTARLDLALGWTSNASAGSPVDAESAREDASSPTGQVGGWLQLVAPASRYLRPSAELEGRALGYTSDAGQPFSYLLVSGRPGLIIGDSTPNALLAYRYESFLLAGGDRYNEGPIWFYNAHRGEVEVSLLPALTLFAGAGKRLYREIGRTRTELDGGVGGNVDIDETWRLLGALTARGYNAHTDKYDLIGGTLLISAEARLPERWSMRGGALVDFDSYPDSAGAFTSASSDTHRRDTGIKLSISAFFPPLWDGAKAGLTYEYSQRFSTVAAYDYTDHRILAKWFWNLSFDPWLPRAYTPEGHVAIDYGLNAEETQERIQDLLRREESIQRGSSCVE
ncbi:MAG: hypothetical protein JXA30_16350 [Deltaproteobacteria bacterium]|nr:hypothetical protein [Deltaproteobacteria bacterium]